MHTIEGLEYIKAFVKTLPSLPGVYRMLSEKGDPLYIGKAKVLKNRVKSYTQFDALPKRLQRMVAQTREMEIIVTKSEVEALLLEADLIYKLQPKYNILLKDDKVYPYILLTKDHDYPKVLKHRGVLNRPAQTFGPFASVDAVNKTIAAIQKVFKLRNCKDNDFATRHRPCLQYHIKQCTAPCVGYVSKEEYQSQVDEATAFLKGNSKILIGTLKEKMIEASKRQDYERAAHFRDQVHSLENILSGSGLNLAGLEEADAFAIFEKGGIVGVQVFFVRKGYSFGNKTFFPRNVEGETLNDIFIQFLEQFYAKRPASKEIFISEKCDVTLLQTALSEMNHRPIHILQPQRGQKKALIDHVKHNVETAVLRKLAEKESHEKALKNIQEVFGLARAPERIEVYDNSHIQGAHNIATIITAGPEGFIKESYRKFNMDAEEVHGDDFAMMRAVFLRRFSKPNEGKWQYPDLVFIDGGKGQLTAARESLKKLDLDGKVELIAIAKGEDRHAGREVFYRPKHPPLQLPFNDPSLFYIQRLRDEAHRFAIESHRKRRDLNMKKSILEDIPGVGPKTKKALVQHFGGVKFIARATIEELQSRAGLGRVIAERVHHFFREKKDDADK